MENYKLTKYSIGSVKEIWALSWPLMLGLMSGSLMMFVDRLLLAKYSTMALNAGANASMAYFLFLVLPMVITAISEVLVGRHNGEGNLQKTGNAAWQMVWFSLLLTPLFWLSAYFLPPLLFYSTGNELLETEYFQGLMLLAPFTCSSIAFSGFFIGIGRVKIITYATIAANIVNLLLAYVLLFGWGPVPALGIFGAGLATGLAQGFQTLLLLAFFLRHNYRSTYATHKWSINWAELWEGIKIGAPSGTGRVIEMLAHLAFFRILLQSGSEQLTVVAIVQSLFIFFGFMVDAQSKALSTLAANLIGAKEYSLIPKVLLAGVKQQLLLFSFVFAILFCFNADIIQLFSTPEEALWRDPEFLSMASNAILWMCLFFLFDGLSWMFIGLLTASGDTKYILYVSLMADWFLYVLPVYVVVGIWGYQADAAWMLVAFYSATTTLLYYLRYRSGYWLPAAPALSS